MATIEVTEEQKKAIVKSAETCGLSVGDFLTHAIEVIYGSFKVVESLSNKKENPPPASPKYHVRVGDKNYEANSARQMLLKIVSGIGPIRILSVYRGYGLKTSLDKDDNEKRYTKVMDGKNCLYLYTHMSANDIWKRIEKFASLLKLNVVREE
jgi:hypothetical protein